MPSGNWPSELSTWSRRVARLAAKVRPQKLILFHLSDRYTPQEWREQVAEVRGLFPETYFPEAWDVQESTHHAPP